MNPAERKRKSREKLKANLEKLEEFLEKERIRDGKRRKKIKDFTSQNEEAKALWREKERVRKRKARARKKITNSSILIPQLSSPLGSYKCINTLRKAVIKTQKSLPDSPLKKQAVLLELAKAVPKPPIFAEDSLNKKRSIISDQDKKKAQSFYERDDISRAAPGRKDTKSVKNQATGVRTHIAKRHMVMSVAEAYALFKEKHPDVRMGKSMFYEMRPVHVRPMSEMPHNVCVCMYHANYSFLVEAVHRACVIFPATSTELLEEINCNCLNEQCMMSICKKCFDIYDLVPQKYDENIKVSWKLWTKTEHRLQVATISGTMKELLQELQSQTLKFKQHVFIKRRQSEVFQTQKVQTTNEEVLLQVDFAENFAILSQDEIQSAHWSHPQVTLFTGCAWADKGEDKSSYLIISNELSHDKYAVWAFLKKIIEDLKSDYPSLKKVYIFSDGCAAQFKNRYTLSNICWSQQDWSVEVEWNFFATSHGKGAMDGVGATAKQSLWNAIMTRRQIINTSWDCYDYLKTKTLKDTKIHFVAIDDISLNKENLDKRWSDIQPIPYIQKQHYFRALSDKCLAYAVTAKSLPKKILLFQDGKLSYDDVYSESDKDDSDSEDNINHSKSPTCVVPSTSRNAEDCTNKPIRGAFVLVEIESESKKSTYTYVAVCQSEMDIDGEIRVMFFKNSSCDNSKMFIANEQDIADIKIEQIVKILQEPALKVIGDRVYYEFKDNLPIFEK